MKVSSQKIIVFEIICYADYDSAAKSKRLYSNFATNRNGRQMKSSVIMEIESETKHWLP